MCAVDDDDDDDVERGPLIHGWWKVYQFVVESVLPNGDGRLDYFQIYGFLHIYIHSLFVSWDYVMLLLVSFFHYWLFDEIIAIDKHHLVLNHNSTTSDFFFLSSNPVLIIWLLNWFLIKIRKFASKGRCQSKKINMWPIRFKFKWQLIKILNLVQDDLM